MNIVKNSATVIVSILFLFLFLEIVLRILGNNSRIDDFLRDEPVVYQEDIELGWTHKPGNYIFKPWSQEGKITNLTINPDGSRKILNQNARGLKILFFGGSVTQGWAVDDSETFANYFQNKKKNSYVFNFGVGGYGGFQSLLLQERVTKELESIDHIIYGFIDHHEIRNVAAGSWLYMLTEYSSRGHINLPYASIYKNELKKNKPVNYIKLPLSEYSSLIAKVEKRIMKLKSFAREKKKFEISKLVIEEMLKNAKSNNAKFTVLFLSNSDNSLEKYKNFFNEAKINYINCQFPKNQGVKGEGHPNEVGHKNVADCLIKNLQ